VHTDRIQVTALGTLFDNVGIAKVISFLAFNNLPGVTIMNFNLPRYAFFAMSTHPELMAAPVTATMAAASSSILTQISRVLPTSASSSVTCVVLLHEDWRSCIAGQLHCWIQDGHRRTNL
jgi:hypothetical protein